IGRPLAAERKRQLLGISGDNTLPANLLTEVFEWWRKDVLGPAEAIANNPAASCAEAGVGMQTLLGMMRQRQLLGMSPDDADHSAEANKTRALEAELDQILDSARGSLATRCREEALDECIVTGHFDQILQTDLGLSRQEQLMPTRGGIDSDEGWVDDALKQCAVYELHFVSTTKVAPLLNMETVLDGKITLRFDAGAGGIFSAVTAGKKLEDMLKGQTTGAENPFLVSVKCSQPGLQVTCSPGAPVSPVMARVKTMELQHREFYVDGNGISKVRIVGEDKFAFEFSGGIYSVQAFVTVPNGPKIPFPMPAQGMSFYIAHKKDRLGTGPGQGTAVIVQGNKRGVIPMIFDFIYTDQGTESNVPASDSTQFQLIHKPEPKPIKRKPDPIRKPLKPRPGTADQNYSRRLLNYEIFKIHL
ncbi:MAG TPA: hypothetical protein VHQ01_04660, partial [Pyrinomonadaceae bacterium]|nr:hypothetical protein [Pyrinomonadaceae bacterium]